MYIAAVTAVAWVVAVEWLFAAAWLSPVGWALAMAPATLLLLWTLTPVHANRPEVRWFACRVVLLCVLVVLLPWNDRKQFVHDVYSVRAGMSVDEVEAVMGGYIKGAGAAWQVPEVPDPRVSDVPAAVVVQSSFDAYREPAYPDAWEREHFTGTMIYRWSTRAAFNADWGSIAFVDGKVVEVGFLPD